MQTKINDSVISKIKFLASKGFISDTTAATACTSIRNLIFKVKEVSVLAKDGKAIMEWYTPKNNFRISYGSTLQFTRVYTLKNHKWVRCGYVCEAGFKLEFPYSYQTSIGIDLQ
ncbi:MAG: hypothetical protein KDH96_07025 [Candidatus Riesia sp.]|nr:hypothetical protein [Candidatus Riesia sp.]